MAELLTLLSPREYAVLRKLGEAGADGACDSEAARSLSQKMPGTILFDSERRTVRIASRAAGLLIGRALSGFTQSSRDGQVPSAPIDTLRLAQAAGDYERAADLLSDLGGPYFINLHGFDLCAAVLRAFPPEFVKKREVLVVTSAMYALKSGNLGRTRRILLDYFGPDFLDIDAAIGKRHYPVDLRLFRFVMATFEGAALSAALQEKLFELPAELELDDHLNRGVFYNAMLASAVDRHTISFAEDLADRARYHYRRTGAHLLLFYIDLHRGLIALRRGGVAEASGALKDARQCLEHVSFETPSDWRLLTMLAAVVAFERGETSPLLRFIEEEFKPFAHGELWPAIARPILTAGSRLLLEQAGPEAALAFLDRWRMRQWRSRRFEVAIAMQETAILQMAARWRNAAGRLSSIPSRITPTWVEHAENALARLVDPMEIELAMAGLRHLIEQAPRRLSLRDRIAALMGNDAIGERDRARLELWSAFLARMDRDIASARRHFAGMLDRTARLGGLTHLHGDAAMFETLRGDKRIACEVLSAAGRRETARRLKARFLGAETGHPPLTRQELRTLRLVAEGGTNKLVARQMRVSEATVKFHLSNTYRKMGCGNRGEAIAAAHALGWVSVKPYAGYRRGS
ncbi:MAG: LuxR C-terminal-related transcriptional regulator [Hyphomicrobiales bacterium]